MYNALFNFRCFLVRCDDEIGESFTCDVKEVTDGQGIGYVMRMSHLFIVMHVLVTCNTTLNTIEDFTCNNGFRDGMKLPLESGI